GHAPAQDDARDARGPGDRAHRARHGGRSRESHRGRLRRLRHQARRAPEAPCQDRGAARAPVERVTIDPAAQLRHDLRTPLNHIIGYAEMLLEDGAGGSSAAFSTHLRILLADARELLSLVNDLLALGAGRSGPADLAAARHVVTPPLELIRAADDTLHACAAAGGAGDLLADLDRIRTATQALVALLGPSGVAAPSSAERVDTGAGDTAAGARRALILVVDDNEGNRDMLARRLARQGYEVRMAAGGRAALDLLGKESVDLVLLDVMMPDLDGYAVLEQMKADPGSRHIPVVMISALDEMDSVVRCIQLGAEDYLP